MPAPEAISVSQINLYRTCSLKYRFQYLDALPRRTVPAAVVFGRAVHRALEWLHTARKAGDAPDLATLLRVFEADWHAQGLDTRIDLADGTSVPQLLATGRGLLRAYYQAPATPVLEAEWFFEVPLVDPATKEVVDVPLRGVIDLIETDGTVVEFKTAQRRQPPSSLPDDVQLTAYSYAYQHLFGRPPTGLRRVTLLRTRWPAIERQSTTRGLQDYVGLVALATEVRRGIRAGIFVPNRGCWLCRDCEYDQDCREWTGNDDHPEAAP